MLFKNETLVIIGQLFLIVILSLVFSSSKLAPLNNGRKEGFTPLEYTGVLAPTVATDDLYKLNSDNTSTECKKVGGFPGYGVFCSPSSKPENIDIYSKAKGDLSCESLGYYNSKGQLCLDENMKRMLTTRGANATGGNGQIGSN